MKLSQFPFAMPSLFRRPGDSSSSYHPCVWSPLFPPDLAIPNFIRVTPPKEVFITLQDLIDLAIILPSPCSPG